MPFASVCRVCLRGAVRSRAVDDPRLVAVYEQLACTKLVVRDGRPGVLCGACLAQLRRCRVFADTALRTDRLLQRLVCTNKLTPETVAGLRAAGPHLSVDTLPPASSPAATDETTVKEEPTEAFIEREPHLQDESRPTELELGCEECGLSFESRRSLAAHLARRHAATCCRACDKVFASEDGMRAHAAQCGRTFRRKPYLQGGTAHRTHTPTPAQVSCGACSATFATRSELASHARSHSAPPPPRRARHRPRCELCHLTLASNSHLILHMRTHTGEKPFACDVPTCRKSFRSKSTLKSHGRTHTGEKVCSCEVCGKAFSQTGSLGKHMVVHSGLLPYACRLCDKAYKQSGQLAAHVRNHHEGVKRFACEQCGARFTARSHLTRHANAHAGLKPHACLECGARFSTTTVMKRHLNNSCKLLHLGDNKLLQTYILHFISIIRVCPTLLTEINKVYLPV